MSTEKFYKLPVELAARTDLTPASKLVWAVLGDRVGDNGVCWPGVRSLAGDVGQDASSVLRGIQKLETAGLLQVERQGNGRRNYYRLTASESAGETQALAKCKRSQNANGGAGETQAQALAKCKHNQTDQLNQTPDSVRLADLLFSEILARKPDYKKPNLKTWARDVDRMIRLDKRKPERIAEVIVWCQQDAGHGEKGFGWANNILSALKLREKFDRLELDMTKRPGRVTVAPVVRGKDGKTPRQRLLEKMGADRE